MLCLTPHAPACRRRLPPKALMGIATTLFAAQLGLSAPAQADPPPWAPAHGYYKNKHGHYKEGRTIHRRPWADRDDYVSGYVTAGRCNREELGYVLGGVAGGVAGAQIGKGDGRTAATIVGTIVGALIGGSMGRSMDQADAACMGQALEYGEPGAPVGWVNPDTGAQYSVTPMQSYQQNDSYCREFTREAIIGGKREQTYGTACRQADGSWKMVR
jgi:surface antigen